MPRTPRSRNKASRPTKGDWNHYDEREVMSLVTRYFCRDHPPAEIRKLIKAEHGITLRREEPWDLLRKAAKHGWFHLWPPFDDDLGNRIADQYGLEVGVARTATSEDVCLRGAERLLRTAKRIHKQQNKDTIHIGFAGGGALKLTAQYLAEMLIRETDKLPGEIVFHALVGGFDPTKPSTDPNAFFSYFDVDRMPVKTSFVGLPAPALLTTQEREILRNIKPIEDAIALKEKLDIIITSGGGHWKRRHSGLSNAYKEYASNVAARDWIGDIMWQPIAKDGPADLTGIDRRAFTLMDLGELAGFIRRGKRVMLLLGPCGGCGHPKTDVLRAILDCKVRMITDLLVDSRTAKELLG
jgi:DNA-binding transcriptional regulator LsrR (DeoR family)